MFREARDRAETAFAALYADESRLRFLHADLHPWNIKLDRGQLHVLDFDGSIWCYPVQDIGIALYYHTDRRNYPEVCADFERGYTSVRPWPAADEMIVRR